MYEVVQSHFDCQQGTLLESTVYKGVTVARVTSASVKDGESIVIYKHLHKLAKHQAGRLALDCSALTGFTCSWINSLLKVTKMCRNQGWDLAIYGLTGPARDILRTTQLDRQLTVCDDRDQALAVLGIEPPSPWQIFAAPDHHFAQAG